MLTRIALTADHAVIRNPIILDHNLFDKWQVRLNEEFGHEPEIDRVLAFAQGAIIDSVLDVIGLPYVNTDGTITFIYQPSALLLAAAKVAHRGDLTALCRTLGITEADVIAKAKNF